MRKYLFIFVLCLFLTACGTNIEEELLSLGYEFDGTEYVYELNNDAQSQINVDAEFGYMTLESKNAKIELDANGSIYCSENLLNGDCDDARTTSGIFAPGQQIRVELSNLHSNSTANMIYLNTAEILGFDTSAINEIVDLDLSDETSNDENSNDETSDTEASTDTSTDSSNAALDSAQSYVDMSGFSETGLKDQLEFEGYTTEQIDSALEAVDVNYNEEALESAESYAEMSGFSEAGLQDQLDYEGYTAEQIQYAIDNLEVNYGEEALEAAQSYIDMSGFSEVGLQEQLEYEDYSSEDIQYALENVTVDYNEEALESAQSYLEMSSFSETELQDQLSYEGYTTDQIQYAITNT